MNFHVCIQARLSSSRLPYKILLPVNCSYNSPSIIYTLLSAVQELNHPVSLLSPANEKPILSKIIYSLKDQHLIDNAFYGDGTNVMNRYREYFEGLQEDDVYIVRLCADSPCIPSSYIKYIIDSASSCFNSTDSLLVTTRDGIGCKGFNIDVFHPLFWSHQFVLDIISSSNDDRSLLKIISSIPDQVSIVHGDISKFIHNHLLDIGAIDTALDYSALLSKTL